MLELIYGMVGIVFAWVVLGSTLLPAAVLIEMALGAYTRYATKNDVGFPRVFRAIWCRWVIDGENGGWAEKKGIDALFIIPQAIAFLWVVVSVLHHVYGHGDLAFTEALVYASFGMYVSIGTWSAPALLLIFVVLTPTLLTRKVFDLKQRFTKHVKDKEAHQ